MAGFKIASAYVTVEADDTGLRDSMAAKIKAAAAGLDAAVKLNVDAADLRAKIDAATAAGGAGAQGATIHMGVDTGDSTAKLAAMDAAVKHVDDSGNGLTQDANGRWRNALGQFASDAEKAAAGVEDLGTKSDGAKGKIKGAGDAGDGTSLSFGFLATKMSLMVQLGSALGPALAALPALLAGAGAAAGTLGLAFAGVKQALTDHMAASTAVGQSSAQLAATQAADAIAIRNANQSIVDAKKAAAAGQIQADQQIISAQQALMDAERQAATAAQSSADAVVNAQRGIVTSNYSLQQSQQGVENATYSLQQAQLSETNAVYAQQQAVQALTQAQADAANTIADAKNSAADSHLAVKAALQAEEAAQTNLNLANVNGMTSPKQQAVLQLQLEQAQQAVVDAKQRDLEATQKANQANQQGVDGLPSVVSAQHAVQQAADAVAASQHGVTTALEGQQAAQHAVTLAVQGQADAQHALMLATQAQTNQQISSAESIQKAQQGLTQAIKAASDQQISSAQSVARAVQSLTDTQQQQALAAAAAAASAGGAANKFAQDMTKGTPAMRAMVDQLLSMKGGFDQLKATAQTATLPGFTKMLQDLQPMLGPFNTAVGDMGRMLGGLATQFGALFQSPAFQGAFFKVLQEGTGLLQQLGQGVIGMFSGITQAAAAAGPIVDAVGSSLQGLMASGIPALFQGLTTGAAGSAQTIKALVGFVSDMLGPIGKLAGAFSSMLGPALTTLRPVLKELADLLVNTLVPVFQALSPILNVVAQLIAGLMPVVTPVIGVIGQLATILLQSLMPILTPLIPVFVQLMQAIGSMLTGVLTPLVPLVKLVADEFVKLMPVLMPIIKAFLQIIEALMPLMPLFVQIVGVIASLVVPILGTLLGWFGKLVDYLIGPLTDCVVGIIKVFTRVMKDIADAVKTGVKWVTDHFDSIVKFVEGLPDRFIKGTENMWGFLSHGMKDGLNDVIGGFNWLIDQINGLIHGISDAWTWAGAPAIPAIPHVPKLARGGVLTASGFVDVGDNDRERIFLPKGASVVPLPKTPSASQSAGGGPQLIQNFYGPQHPTGEQRAAMYREWNLQVAR